MNNFTSPLSRKMVAVIFISFIFCFTSVIVNAQAVYTTAIGDWTQSWNSNSGSYQAGGGPGIFSFGTDPAQGQVNTRLLTSDGTTGGSQQALRVGQKLRIRINAPIGGGRTGIQSGGRIGFALKSTTGLFDGTGGFGRYNANSLMRVEFQGGQSTAQIVDGGGTTLTGMPNFTDFINGQTYEVEMISDKEYNLQIVSGTRFNIRSMTSTSSVKQITIANLGENRDGVYTLVEVANTPTVSVVANGVELLTVTGVITNNGGTSNTLTKTGTGTVTLTGQNTYTGLTTVSNGTLRLNAPGANTINPGNDITLASGGTMQVSQDQAVGNLTVPAGSTLQVDAGKTLTITGTYTGGGTIINNGTISLSGTPSQSFPGSGTVSAMNNLTINNNSVNGVTLDAELLTVTGTLNFSSNGGLKSLLTTGSNVVEANTITGASAANGWVNGNLRKNISVAGSYTFEVGTSAGYTDAGIIFSAVGSSGFLTVASFDGASSNYPAALSVTKRLARYWSVVNTGITGFTASTTFNYLGSDLTGGATQSSVKPYKFDGPSTYSYPASSTGSNSFTQTGITSFSEFGAGECGVVTVAPITGNSTICNGATSLLSSTTPDGVWSSDNGTIASVNLAGLVTGNASGSTIINYTVTDASGCIGVATKPITVYGSFDGSYTNTNVSACVGNDGTITVTATGGSGNYTYSWTGQTGPGGATPFTAGNTASLTGLNYGYYNVTINDAQCGQLVISNIHIQFAFTVVVTNSGSTTSACGNNGSIILYGNAGVQPYTYSIDGTTYQASNLFTGLSAGTYTGYIKDATGCVGTKPNIVIAAAAPLVVNPFVRNASSCSNDGTIEVYRTGGIPPYTYSLDNVTFQTSNVFSGLAAGAYTAYVKDSKGCVGSQATTVNQGTALSLSTLVTSTSTCTIDGTVRVTVSGGVAPFTYSKDGVIYQASNLFTGLASGPYTVYAKDSKGCTGQANVTVNLNTINVTSNVINGTTCVSNNGSIQLFRTGGVGPYTYSLDGNTYQPGTIFTNLVPGTYDGYVKDSKGCIGVQNGIVVNGSCLPPPITNGVYSKSTVANVKTAENDLLNIQVYPNPSASSFLLRTESTGDNKVNIKVTDVTGRIVYQAVINGTQQHFFGNDLQAGLYIVQVTQGVRNQNVRIVKE